MSVTGKGSVYRGELPLPDRRFPKLTHYLFRYPAKFHPPVVAALLDRYTSEFGTVLDPFVGSGTLLVEATVAGRAGLGLDVDPVAVRVARAKTHRYNMRSVMRATETLINHLRPLERSPSEYERLMHTDITQEEAKAIADHEGLLLPAIPNLGHWFRSYASVDLARILSVIDGLKLDTRTDDLIRVAFASAIRNCSNADPVPVSGLEYTSHMKRRDEAGRLVNPFVQVRQALLKAVAAVEEWGLALPKDFIEPRIWTGDAKKLPRGVPKAIDAVITSPPYHNAVDYYRRHQLEMFWLGLTSTQEQRLQLLPSYIGRPGIAAKDPLLQLPWNPHALADEWEQKIRAQHPRRADDFRHYVTAMTQVFTQLASRLTSGAPAVFVVGKSRWNGATIPTEDLFTEISADFFDLDEVLSYPVKNRYMSYTRHNQASIDREYVVVLRRQ